MHLANRPRRLRRASVAVALSGALALSACSSLPGGVVASVNGEEITDDFLGALVEQERGRLVASGADVDDVQGLLAGFQRDAMSQVIQFMLLSQEADARGINVTQAEADDLWDDQIALAGGEEALLARIAELGLDEEAARRQIVQNELVERLQDDVRAAVVVTDEEVRAVYEQRADQWNVATVAHIALATEEEALEVQALIASGEATFEDMADERSIDTSTGPLGGALGESSRGTYPPEFDDAVWGAAPGEVVGPIETTFGFHLILVSEFRTIAFEEMQERLDEEIRGQRFQDEFSGLVAALIAESDVEVDGRFGEWDGNGGGVVEIDLLRPATTA